MMESDTETLEIVAPFLPRAVLNELCSGRQFDDYRRRKVALLQQGTERAIFRQRMIGRHNAQCQTREVPGLGRWRACIDPFIYFAAREKYGEKCWQDPEFLKDTLEKTPECRVPDPVRKSFAVGGISRRSDAAEQSGNGRTGELDVSTSKAPRRIFRNNE